VVPASYRGKTCKLPGDLIYDCPQHVKGYKAKEKPKPWRCEPCGKDLALESQLQAHFAQHVVCPEPMCSFSASKRVVTKHVSTSHILAAPTPTSAPAPKTSGPPAEYCCKICKVPGHWIAACPQHIKPKSNATDPPPAAETILTAVPAHYRCKICNLPGHLIYDCAQYIKGYKGKENGKAAQTGTAKEIGKTTENSKPFRCEPCDKDMALESQLQMHIRQHESCPEPDCGFSAAKRIVTQHMTTAHGQTPKMPNQEIEVQPLAERPDEATSGVREAKANLGRCDVCDTDFKVAHQHDLHFTQHVPCPEPWCDFSAIKRVVTEHVKRVHTQEPTPSSVHLQAPAPSSENNAGLADTSLEVVVQGRTYRLQEIEVDGLTCMVLVDAAGSTS
jgi:hypothetical protein